MKPCSCRTGHLPARIRWPRPIPWRAAIEKIGDVALILCGKQAIDGDTAQVGPEIAENLDWPHVTYVRKVNEISDKK